jgi:hypothetical protein
MGVAIDGFTGDHRFHPGTSFIIQDQRLELRWSGQGPKVLKGHG